MTSLSVNSIRIVSRRWRRDWRRGVSACSKAKILRTMVQKCVLYSAGVSKNLLLCAMMTTLVLGALLKPAHAWIATSDTKPTCDACNWK